MDLADTLRNAMYYDVHTHSPKKQEGVVCVENMQMDFDSDISNRSVSMGLHPWFLNTESWVGQLARLRQNILKAEVLAIGECGLDKLSHTDWDLQMTVFRGQINLAQEVGKPLVIHCVRAFAEVLMELRSVRVPVIFHGINNKRTLVQPVIDAGYYLSFGKSLISAHPSLADTFNATPMERILLETDGTATVDIRDVYKSAARIKNISEKEIVLQLEKNFSKLFYP